MNQPKKSTKGRAVSMSNRELAKATRGNKYRAVKTECSAGHRHDSAKEAGRCGDLRLLEKARQISDLEQQPNFLIDVDGMPVCHYRADFSYLTSTGQRVVEDVKGIRTPLYRLKAKLMRACYGITILET